jgi:hypothetical protein
MDDYFKAGISDTDLAFFIASKNVAPGQIQELSEKDIRDMCGQDFGLRLKLAKLVKNQADKSSSRAKLSIVKAFLNPPKDLDLWPPKIDPVKILKEPHLFYNLPEGNSKHLVLVKYLLILLGAIKSRGEVDICWSSPLIYLIRVFSDNEGFSLDNRLRSSWSTLASSDTEILDSLINVDPSILINKPLSFGTTPKTALRTSPPGTCTKLAKFNNCLGFPNGAPNCPYSHDDHDILLLRQKNPTWPLPVKRPTISSADYKSGSAESKSRRSE